ncbi:cytidine deaminase [Gemella bergeri ATCC 700627]|uniref:Cytidine deaminase n=1 Tax=Gemella bergeri ATCC 700627 TaxID=1321820 RepID=U2Q0D6_9BACL|nr:cytidine deaminase [Gemella bergeri]ERK56225.1 cytidine deaminase [Gemella bergeri ATCC 700627]
MIKLIACDMDGTLLNLEHIIPKKNVELIKIAQQNNIKFVVATGRPYYEALPALKLENIKCDIISFNGGIIYDSTGNILDIIPISLKDLYYTVEIFKTLDIKYQLYTKNTVFTENLETDIQAYVDLIRANGQEPNIEHLRKDAFKRVKNGYLTEVENIEFYFNQPNNPPIKVIGLDADPEKLKKAQQLLMTNENLAVTSSGINNLEIMDKNATKGKALRKISDKYNISLKDIISIGDNLNDLSMLEISNISVAMINGMDELKNISTYVTTKDNTEAGVAETIFPILEKENNILNEDNINKLLMKEAIKAADYAYVPYSNFRVGAAILADNGVIYTGCNIENASYSPTNCAERTAIFKAVSEGVRNFKKIAIVGGKKDGDLNPYCPPCGVCRQVIAEFAEKDFKMLLGDSPDNYTVYNFFEEVLPLSFTSKDLKQ